MSGNAPLSDNPKITVVIPTYNRAREIKTAIQSVRRQTLNNWKAIIVDDGSTDGTQRLINKLMQLDSRFTYYRMPCNTGICHVLNQALKLVDTEYMVQVDSDDWLEKKALERLLKKMENNENAAVAYGNHMEHRAENKTKLVRHRGFSPEDKYELLSYRPMMYPRFYRTSCLREVGGWDVNDKYNGRFMEDRRILYKLIENYEFISIDRHLYNLRRVSHNRLTSRENRKKYIELKSTLIKETLERWGNQYRAQISLAKPGGWQFNIKLIPNRMKG